MTLHYLLLIIAGAVYTTLCMLLIMRTVNRIIKRLTALEARRQAKLNKWEPTKVITEPTNYKPNMEPDVEGYLDIPYVTATKKHAFESLFDAVDRANEDNKRIWQVNNAKRKKLGLPPCKPPNHLVAKY